MTSPSAAATERKWIILQRGSSDASLIYGKPDTDDITFDLTCSKGIAKLHYSFEREERPYGTSESVTISVVFGTERLSMPATAIFDEGGSPRIETEDKASANLIAALASNRPVQIVDRWGKSLASPIPAVALVKWARMCGFQIPRH